MSIKTSQIFSNRNVSLTVCLGLRRIKDQMSLDSSIDKKKPSYYAVKNFDENQCNRDQYKDVALPV